MQSKALSEGVEVFEQLAAQQPASSLNQLFLGRLHDRLNHFDAAERAYRKAQELAPEWAEGYRALAELYLRSDVKPGEALVLAKRVIELEPTDSHYYLLAVGCLKNHNRAGALKAVQQALVLSPGEKRYQELLQQLQQAP